MSAATLSSFSGRTAALERRRALSAGKSALPPATERVRNGERSAAIPAPKVVSPRGSPPIMGAPASVASAAPTASFANASQSGRMLSMLRRQRLAGGKRTLQAAAPVPPSADSAASLRSAPAQPTVLPSNPGSGTNCVGSCREQARARRALLSERGRGDGPAASPTRPPRQGTLQYAPKVTQSTTHGGQIVTGSRIGRGTQVTGDEAGAQLPVSGTQYIGASDGPPARSGGPKVGLARTTGGGIVSGTLVRSKVRVTGDEPGASITITGEAEQRAEDDLTPRAAEGANASGQFSRQVDPHGHSVFGTNLGRSASSFGSRDRRREAPIESTENGLPITGSAVGRTVRVTGDHEGACRQVTGSQYLSPARAQAECGGLGGGTAPAAQTGGLRRDPVTGAKVTVAQTWGQQRLTGSNVEHDPRVTGDAAGSCSIITGTPYHGAATVHGWCEPGAAHAAEDRLPRRAALSAITGDVPEHSDALTGTGRGAAREVTGSPYYRQPTPGPATLLEDALAGLDARFSVTSPQRSAQLRARAAQETEAKQPGNVAESGGAASITGSFAIARDRVTGNAEFLFKSRSASATQPAAARLRLTGEGRADEGCAEGSRVTGWSWSEQSNVTGTEGAIAADRNPSERAGKPQSFSGARRFKTLVKREEAKQLVTGLLGWSGKTAARVTLSGGAQA